MLAFCGTGKSYFAGVPKNHALDFVCMPFKYHLPAERESAENEALKAEYGIELLNPAFPNNYVEALLNRWREDVWRYVLAPPDWRVASMLEKLEIPYTLIYPETGLQDEYERRFKDRGNGEAFLQIFIGGWADFMRSMDRMNPEKRIRLKSGQYLTDVLM